MHIDLTDILHYGPIIACGIEIIIAMIAFFVAYRYLKKFFKKEHKSDRIWAFFYVLLGVIALASPYFILFY